MARLEYVLRETESPEAAHQLLIDGGATGRAHLGTHLCQVTQDPTSRREGERERERERERENVSNGPPFMYMYVL